jgi:hypothetical protein
MANIAIGNLNPAGFDLFAGNEGFMDEVRDLNDNELSVMGGKHGGNKGYGSGSGSGSKKGSGSGKGHGGGCYYGCGH